MPITHQRLAAILSAAQVYRDARQLLAEDILQVLSYKADIPVETRSQLERICLRHRQSIHQADLIMAVEAERLRASQRRVDRYSSRKDGFQPQSYKDEDNPLLTETEPATSNDDSWITEAIDQLDSSPSSRKDKVTKMEPSR